MVYPDNSNAFLLVVETGSQLKNSIAVAGKQPYTRQHVSWLLWVSANNSCFLQRGHMLLEVSSAQLLAFQKLTGT